MQPQPNQPDLSIQVYDVKDVAGMLRVHPDTVRGLINAGRLKAKRLGKQRALRVSHQALQEFLADYDA